MLRVILLFLTVIFLNQPFIAFAQTSSAAAITESSWADWAGSNEKVSYRQLVDQLAKPYRGEEAAALAAIATELRKHKRYKQ